MIVTATEFKTNFGKYLEISLSEDVFITKNGKIIAKVSNPNESSVKHLSGLLSGFISSDFDKKIFDRKNLKHENDN